MPLLTKNQRISAALAERANNTTSHLTAAVNQVNSMVEYVLALNNEDLADWLNSQPANEVFALFTAHGQLGDQLNAASTTAAVVLASSGLPAPTASADTRSFQEKLAAMGRTFVYDGTTFSVSDISQPDPVVEPEPTPEPEPQPE